MESCGATRTLISEKALSPQVEVNDMQRINQEFEELRKQQLLRRDLLIQQRLAAIEESSADEQSDEEAKASHVVEKNQVQDEENDYKPNEFPKPRESCIHQTERGKEKCNRVVKSPSAGAHSESAIKILSEEKAMTQPIGNGSMSFFTPSKHTAHTDAPLRVMCNIDARSHIKVVQTLTSGSASKASKPNSAQKKANATPKAGWASKTTVAKALNVVPEEKVIQLNGKKVHQRAKDDKENEKKHNGTSSIGDMNVKDLFKYIRVNTNEYLVLDRLGRGGSSVVYHCYSPKTRRSYAIKCVDLSKNEVIGFMNEINVLKRLQDCDRIIRFYEHELVQDQKRLYVIMERGGADLAHILNDYAKKSHQLPQYMIIYYWMQMLYAVKQIHEHSIIHADLKPANFIQTDDHLKLIDFGISSKVQGDMTSVMKTVALGTVDYISPEALKNDNRGGSKGVKPQFKIHYRTDVWSLGCILYEMIYKRPPFHRIEHAHAKILAITDEKHQIDFPPVDYVPSKLIECLRACLRHDARSRPSVEQLIEHCKDFTSDLSGFKQI